MLGRHSLGGCLPLGGTVTCSPRSTEGTGRAGSPHPTLVPKCNFPQQSNPLLRWK